MVWDSQVLRARPLLSFICLSYSIHFCLLLFAFSDLSAHIFVIVGRRLRADRMSIALSRPCIEDILKVIIIIIIIIIIISIHLFLQTHLNRDLFEYILF